MAREPLRLSILVLDVHLCQAGDLLPSKSKFGRDAISGSSARIVWIGVGLPWRRFQRRSKKSALSSERFCFCRFLFLGGGGAREGRCPGGFRPWRAPYPMRAVMLSMATPRLEVHRLPDLCPHRHLPRVQPPCSHSSDEACMELSLVQQRPPFRAQSSTGTGRRRAVRGRAPWARWTSDQPCLLTQASSRASGRHHISPSCPPASSGWLPLQHEFSNA
ncbi:unnamed protein product [Prorocentrum cordatum]|uniref:Uncharacterized protein n=1 Tax=Prorocentrum cordatum TaxID=2364126 RepID=A0ABN9SLN8_9DINO|nr:unnamed protein product [Polarella glacialis]